MFIFFILLGPVKVFRQITIIYCMLLYDPEKNYLSDLEKKIKRSANGGGGGGGVKGRYSLTDHKNPLTFPK